MERRAHPRVEVSQPTLYTSNIYPSPRVASVVEISLGGARIDMTPHSVIPGEGLQISIAIDRRVIKCGGQVVHILKLESGRLQVGVQFEGMSKHDRLYLKQYLFHVLEKDASSHILKKAPH